MGEHRTREVYSSIMLKDVQDFKGRLLVPSKMNIDEST